MSSLLIHLSVYIDHDMNFRDDKNMNNDKKKFLNEEKVK